MTRYFPDIPDQDAGDETRSETRDRRARDARPLASAGRRNKDFSTVLYQNFKKRVPIIWAAGNHRIAPAQRSCAGFRKFSGGGKLCIARARRARAGLTVHPPWIQIIDVFAASSQSCDQK